MDTMSDRAPLPVSDVRGQRGKGGKINVRHARQGEREKGKRWLVPLGTKRTTFTLF